MKQVKILDIKEIVLLVEDSKEYFSRIERSSTPINLIDYSSNSIAFAVEEKECLKINKIITKGLYNDTVDYLAYSTEVEKLVLRPLMHRVQI